MSVATVCAHMPSFLNVIVCKDERDVFLMGRRIVSMVGCI